MDGDDWPRPLDSYGDKGCRAYWNALPESSCPYSAGTMAHADWVMGYRETVLTVSRDLYSEGNLRSDDSDAEEALYAIDMEFRQARAERFNLQIAVSEALPPVTECEAAIGIPATEWPMRCYEIACAIVQSGILSHLEDIHGRVRTHYGVYDGEVAPESPFFRKPIIRHGWIEFKDGLVVDPTRFVFTGQDPSLWAGSIDEYDHGANRLRRKHSKAAPPWDATDSQIRWTANDPEITEAVSQLLGDKPFADRRTLSRHQMFWLANMPPEVIGPLAKSVYLGIEAAGCSALIPIDNREYFRDPHGEQELPPAFRLG
jgi:hypothetical protein